jgi:UDP-glucose-4-epimerase GalE
MHYDILITGGLGYIGSHFLKYISGRYKNILVLDNATRGNSAYVRNNFEVINLDLKDKPSMLNYFKDKTINTVVHFAAYAYVDESTKKFLAYAENNISGIINLLNICEKVEVENFVFSSSCATYGLVEKNKIITENFKQEPINPYGWTKLVGEQILTQLNTKMKIATLRYFNATGNDKDCILGEEHDPETHVIPLVLNAALFQKYPNLFQKTEFTIFGDDYDTPDGTCIRDYIHIKDLCEAHFKCINKLTKSSNGFNVSYNLGAGRGVSILEIIKEVENQVEIKMKYKVAERREGDPPSLVAGTLLAEKNLGFKSKHSSISEIISDVLKYKLKKLHK